MSNYVITIARQYGSGGRTIGEMLSKQLGISYYDKQIIQMASDESGIDLSLFGKVESGISVKSSLFGKTAKYTGEVHSPDSKKFISDENIFNYQAKVVKDLLEKESFVIVGRCVNHIFKDDPRALRVFVHAPWEYRIEKSREKVSGTTEDIEKFLLKDDKRKEEYYNRFVGGRWADARNYDLCINSAKLGFDKSVELILREMELMGLK
ncbi:MAG: cytidylate kinase-like family protein [Eubacteriales bacterium]|nr:cytidylate kinase-like family protein [Eubacteriales bacterium]